MHGTGRASTIHLIAISIIFHRIAVDFLLAIEIDDFKGQPKFILKDQKALKSNATVKKRILLTLTILSPSLNQINRLNV